MTKSTHTITPQQLPRDPEKLREFPFKAQTSYALGQHFIMVLGMTYEGPKCIIYSRDDTTPWWKSQHVMMGSGRTMVDAMHDAIRRLDVLYRELEHDSHVITDMEISLDNALAGTLV
jgi:hypothetical protein